MSGVKLITLLIWVRVFNQLKWRLMFSLWVLCGGRGGVWCAKQTTTTIFSRKCLDHTACSQITEEWKRPGCVLVWALVFLMSQPCHASVCVMLRCDNHWQLDDHFHSPEKRREIIYQPLQHTHSKPFYTLSPVKPCNDLPLNSKLRQIKQRQDKSVFVSMRNTDIHY